jgi:transposase-like protein
MKMVSEAALRGSADELLIEAIAARVAEALREELESLAAGLVARSSLDDQLTVEQVARRLGVARSTVYAHWREWGGYKLGSGRRAPIRFDRQVLPTVEPRRSPNRPLTIERARSRRRAKRTRRDLLVDAPRLIQPIDAITGAR